jgi:uncharacterized protein (UPF0332 family)
VSSPKQELIAYRLQRAREALGDAESDIEQERLNSAANRIYYAMFYAAIALLATRDLSSSRHSGVIGLFYRHFVQSGDFPPELAQHLGRALEMRTNTDYRDFSVPDSVKVREEFEHARSFVQKVEELIRAT